MNELIIFYSIKNMRKGGSLAVFGRIKDVVDYTWDFNIEKDDKI